MILYFIRHGLAENYGDNFSRELTTKGRILLKEKFESFAKTLEKSKEIQIISSPLTRACQTSEILAGILGIQFIVNEEVYNFQIKDFIKKLKFNKTYIIVSHEPFISTWIRDLCKKNIIVSRGSIHKIEVDKNLQGKLLGLY